MDIYQQFMTTMEGEELPVLKGEFLQIIEFLTSENMQYCLGGAIGFCEYSTPRMCTQTDFILPAHHQQQLHDFLEEHDFELLPQRTEKAIGVISKQTSKWQYCFVFSFLTEHEMPLLQSSNTVEAFKKNNLPLLTPFALVVTTLNAIADGSIFRGRHLQHELYDMIDRKLVNKEDVIAHLTKIGSVKQLKVFEEETKNVEYDWRDARNGIKGRTWGELQRLKAARG